MRKFTRILTLCLACALASAALTPAKAGVREDLARHMDNVRSGENSGSSYGTVIAALAKAALSADLIEELWSYVKDPNESVRSESMGFARGILVRASERKTRQGAVHLILTIAASDESPGMARGAATTMSDPRLKLTRADFTDQARQLILNIVQSKEPYAEDFLLVGLADVPAAAARLRQFAQMPLDTTQDIPWYGTWIWKAHLALARMGDQNEVQYCIRTVDAQKTSTTKGGTLLQDLAYIRQPAAIQALARYLFSDEATPWHGDAGRIVFADRALEALMQSVEGLPLKESSSGSYGPTGIAQARGWLRNYDLARLKIKR